MKLVFVIFNVILLWATVISAATKEFANGNNLFTADVYKEVVKSGNENVLVSPLSAEIVLALTQSGAKDETAEELRNSVHLPNNEEKIRTSMKNLLGNLKSNHDFTLHTANKVYVKKDFPIKDEFKDVATQVYRADLENIDFAKKKKAADVINKWVEDHTENKIHNLVDPNIFDQGTALLLVNALYVQGNWGTTFNNASTKKSDFYKSAADIIQVDTMYDKKLCGYYESTELNAKFLQMFIKGDQTSLVIVLPNEKEGLASLENRTEKIFSPPKFHFEMIDLALPKFRIETKTDFKKILENLGVRKAFSFGDADFSGMAGKKGDLRISEVIQKAFIAVDEEGVEAAAATFSLPVLGAPFLPQRPKKFIVDHPFIFYLMVKDVILFAGKVSHPNF